MIHCLKACVVFVLLACSLRAADFYVAPDGQDSQPGTLGAPFATLERARQAAQQARAGGDGAVTIHLRGGTYYLPQTLVLTAADSGTADAPLVWKAYGEEVPVISGGRSLELQWEPHRDGIFKARVPEGLTSDQLFVNGVRQPMARYPNYNPRVRVFNGYAADAFSRERAARWSNPRGGYIHAMHAHQWGDFHYLITGKDAAGNVIYEGGWQNNRRMGMHGEFRFVENIFEELDAPGEWYLDAAGSTLYYFPPEGTDLKTARVEAVSLRHLVELKGSEQQPVRFIIFTGITFRHTARTFMDNREPLLRSDWTTYRGGAVLFDGAEDCILDHCLLDQVGGNGVFVNKYNRRITIRGCRVESAGANSIAFVGDPDAVRSPLFEYGETQPVEKLDMTPGPRTNNYPADCLVEDCLLVANGRTEKQTAGVQIAMAARITVRHCSIYDCPRAGINIGDGCWGGHVIEFCDVFDTVKETGDHGSFNSWGRDRFWVPQIAEVNRRVAAHPQLPLLDCVETITLRNNRWRCDHGWDIDLDDGSSNYQIVNNLCLNGGIKNREGYHRTVENNIMIGSGFHPHVWFDNSEDVFVRNILTGSYAPIQMPAKWGKLFDWNLFANPAALAAARAVGGDEHSAAGDPKFLDPARGDYRVQEDSPAIALGFRNFPMDQFGVTSPRLKALARTPVGASSKQGTSPEGPKRDPRRAQWLGAAVKSVTDAGEVSAAGLPGMVGVMVLEVPAGSAAERFSLQATDVVRSLDGKPTDDLDTLEKLYRELTPGKQVKVDVFRNQRLHSLTIERLEEKP